MQLPEGRSAFALADAMLSEGEVSVEEDVESENVSGVTREMIWKVDIHDALKRTSREAGEVRPVQPMPFSATLLRAISAQRSQARAPQAQWPHHKHGVPPCDAECLNAMQVTPSPFLQRWQAARLEQQTQQLERQLQQEEEKQRQRLQQRQLEPCRPIPQECGGGPCCCTPPVAKQRPAEAATGTQARAAMPNQPLTTLMIRNVPSRYTKMELAQELGRAEEWDFLYLPGVCGSKANHSYAFVNFATPTGAARCLARWHKKRLARYSAQKPLNICYASTQGFRANVNIVARRRKGGRCEAEGCFCAPITFETLSI